MVAERLGASKEHLTERAFDDQSNKLFNFPFLNKKEWLDIPALDNEIFSIPDLEHFEIAQQENKDSCGLCAAKMVVNTIYKDNNIHKRVSEADSIKSLLFPKFSLIKKAIGITPSQMKTGIQTLIDEQKLPYTTTINHFISYEQIKNNLKNGAYIIFTYMGNSIDNPYKTKEGKKNPALQNIHHPHYCILLHIDEKEKKVTIANPFGYKEEWPFKEFRQRISLHPDYLHSSKLYLPLVEIGLYMPRSCVVVSKNT